MDRESFGRHVKEALASFYDPVRLQASPLADVLQLPRTHAASSAQTLRQTLREAIEALRPPENIPFNRPEWLGYRLLWLRYVQSVSRFDTCDQLGLSPASFYRRHHEAVEAVAEILWERYHQQVAAPEETATAATLSPCKQAREQALRLGRASQARLVSLRELLASVQKTIGPLADQEGVRLRIDAADAPPVVYADSATLRQILLNLLTGSLRLAAQPSLQIAIALQGDQTVWRLRGLDAGRISCQDLRALPGFVVSQGLLEAYGSTLELADDGTGGLCLAFTMPAAKQRCVLVVDDDADAVSLYRRYLQAYGYLVREAQNGQEMQAALEEAGPDLILLDLLMPREDGWGILERLKTSPHTMDIPVIVCSVLRDPSLALALGAVEVLQKPITEEALVRALEEALVQGGTEGLEPP